MGIWLKNNESTRDGAVRITQSGLSKKYLVTNKSNIKIGTMNIKSTNESRWVINVKEIRESSYVFELLTLENVIVDTNNPMIKDVANFNNVFKEVYNELMLDISFSGELLSVLNPSLIRSKWERVKQEMMRLELQQPSIGNVIKLNDDIFDNDYNLFQVIKANELFELFFIGFYGKVMPGNKTMIRQSKFKGKNLNWNYKFSLANNLTNQRNEDEVEINVDGTVVQNFSKNVLEETYGSFDFLDYKTTIPKINCEGKYCLNKTNGMLEKAIYHNYEVVDENLLFTKNEYSIQSYN